MIYIVALFGLSLVLFIVTGSVLFWCIYTGREKVYNKKLQEFNQMKNRIDENIEQTRRMFK